MVPIPRYSYKIKSGSKSRNYVLKEVHKPRASINNNKVINATSQGVLVSGWESLVGTLGIWELELRDFLGKTRLMHLIWLIIQETKFSNLGHSLIKFTLSFYII